MKFDKQNNDAGVSPVVGVILMVAITVILSAIIATFVLDLGGTVSQNPQAGVTFDQSTDAVDVQIVSMENADDLTVSVSNAGTGSQTASVSTAFPSQPQVGDTATVTGLDNNDKITVTASLEGKTSVIQTYTYSA